MLVLLGFISSGFVFAQQRCAANPIDIVFALDSSGSMMQNDPGGLRKSASKNFTDRLNSSIDQAGVVSWDDNIDFVQQLTNNFTLVKAMIDRVDSSGETNLDVGLRASIDELASPRARINATRTMIFLTDGQGTYTPSGQPGSQADRARNAGIIIFTIGLTIAPGSQPERDLMEIASVTGGFYFPAPNASSLDRIFNVITNLTTMYTLCSCQATTVPGNYVLANDLYSTASCITINAANVTLNCRMHKIGGTGNGYGILVNASGTTIRNCFIETFQYGIDFLYWPNVPRNSIIDNNTLTNNTIGIKAYAYFTNLTTNTIVNNEVGVSLMYSLITLARNKISNNGIGVLKDWITFPSFFTFIENDVANNRNEGIFLYRAYGWFFNNTIQNNTDGIYITRGTDISRIVGNVISNNRGSGIVFWPQGSGAPSAYIMNNTLSHNAHAGMYLNGMRYSNINANKVVDNAIGLRFESSSDMDNAVYNNLFNNTANAISPGVNTWYVTPTAGPNIVGGPLISGNFWHDYMGVDLNGDGIGDTLLPYTSNGQIVGGDPGPLAGEPTLVMSGVPRIGSTITFTLNDQWHPDFQYILVFSLGSTPGILLPDGRIIHLNPDPLLVLSLQSPTSIGLQNSIASLNANGQAIATWNIPNIPELAGIRISAAFVTIRGGAPLPIPIPSISPALEIQLLP